MVRHCFASAAPFTVKIAKMKTNHSQRNLNKKSIRPGGKIRLIPVLIKGVVSLVRVLCKGIAIIIRAAKGRLRIEIVWETDKEGNKVRRIKVEH